MSLDIIQISKYLDISPPFLMIDYVKKIIPGESAYSIKKLNIDINLIKDSKVNVAIYNLNGQKIDIILDDYILEGHHNINWTAVNQSSGIYFMKIILDEQTPIVKKIILIK